MITYTSTISWRIIKYGPYHMDHIIFTMSYDQDFIRYDQFFMSIKVTASKQKSWKLAFLK